MKHSQWTVYRWAITIGIVLGTVCIAAFAFLYKLPTVYKYEKDSLKTEDSKMSAHFTEKAVYNSEDTHPFLKTSFENKFYSLDDNGKIAFYEFDGKTFKKIRESWSLSITLPGVKDGAHVAVSLLTVDGKTEGYGVYSDKESTEFPYAFLKVVENRITDNYDYIAFADYTINDYYKNNKTYDDAFVFSSDTKNAECICSDAGENTEMTFPTDFICERNDGFYFFSRPSDDKESGYKLFMKKTVSGKETLVSEDASLPYLFNKDGKIYFLKNVEKDDSDRRSFELTELGKENKPIHVFTGTPGEYIVSEKNIFNPKAKTIYSVERDKTNTMGSSFTVLAVDSFAVSKDGTRMIMTGTFAGNKDRLLAYDFSEDELRVYNGEGLLLHGNSNVTLIDDYIYLLAPAEKASKVRNYVIQWSDII